jgi:hypothetical protein
MTKSRKFAPLVIITVLLLAFSNTIYAQKDEFDPEDTHIFYAGIIGGANFAQVDGDAFAGYRKVGFNAGGIGYVQLHKHVALSWELLYSQRGSKSNQVQPATNDTNVLITNYNIKLSYAEIPVMINYFDKRKSHFGVGVSYSRLVSGSESLATDPPTKIDLTKYPFRHDNFEAVAGAELHLWKGLFLNVRFQYSITPIRTTSPPGFSRTNKQYNNLWTVRLMYLFI